jgi:hypothetical protein
MPLVEQLHVSLARLPQCTGHASGLVRADEQVDVVVHQHEGVDGDAMLAAGVTQESPVVVAVGVVEEDGAAVHPTLRDVQGNAGEFEARQARHGRPEAWKASRCRPSRGMPVGRSLHRVSGMS